MTNPWRDWLAQKQAERREQTAEQVEAEGRVKTGKPPLEMSGKTAGDYRPMLDGLNGCAFRPASYEKRFARDMCGLNDDVQLTVKQARLIEQLYHRYRRQIPNHQQHCVVCRETTD
jgi:hypothetical protein